MKITHYCNSFIAVKENQTVLTCDPWVGGSNYGGWMSYPISSGGTEILKQIQPTHLYISHLHEDHLDPKLLTESANKIIPVFIKTFKDRRLFRRIESYGFKNVIELPPWEAYQLSEDLEITIIPPDTTNSANLIDEIDYDLDTSIVIRSLIDNTFYYNNVDSPMTVDGYKKVREYIQSHGENSKVDIACLCVGAASEYPQCFGGINRQEEMDKIIDSSIVEFVEKITTLQNEAYFSAGGTYIISGKFSALNRYIAQPTNNQLRAAADSVQSIKYFYDLEGGASVEKLDNEWIQSESEIENRFDSKEQAIRQFDDLKYEYTNGEFGFEDKKAIENLFAVAKKKYLGKLEKLSIEMNWKIVFHLYEDLQIDASGNRKDGLKPFKTVVLASDQPERTLYELNCHLDSSLFIGLLQKRFVWNMSLSGSIILFERIPNIFVPTLTFSLNYLTI